MKRYKGASQTSSFPRCSNEDEPVGPVDITITDALGVNVFCSKQIPTDATIRISLTLKSGIYFVNLVKGNGSRSVKKVVINQ
jgi:hypothetical protein